jgi:adenine-specific DNA-methyltransferase
MRYIGSKARVTDAILDLVGGPTPGSTFVDGFCGTGAVAEAAALRGWPVRLNDTLTCATTMAAARLTPAFDVPFAALGGYHRAVSLLNGVRPERGFLWREYSPASVGAVGIERRYLTEANAAKLDAMRRQIADWSAAGAVTLPEMRLLVADVLAALNDVANIAGTYGCFLRTFTRMALEPVEVRPRRLLPISVPVDVHNADVTDVPSVEADIAYFDPPYTKRQYAAYYHLLETVAVGDEPAVRGVTGLRPWHDKASDYCYKTRALDALLYLVERTAARRIVLSYSSEGHVELADLRAELKGLGTVTVYPLGAIGRYRPNQTASDKASSVNEYIIELSKTSALETVA